jgi:hypothetical protein
MTGSAAEQLDPVTAVNDRRWREIRHAATWTVLSAAAFVVFVATKQIKLLYNHAPWANDPFDAVISLAMVFVPLLTLGLLAQLLACRSTPSVPPFRQRSVLRACRLTTAIAAIAVVACWTSVLVGANHRQWRAGATTVLVALLAVASLLIGAAVIVLARAPRPAAGLAPPTGTDWAADLVRLAASLARCGGPLAPPALALIRVIDMKVVARVRARPVLTATMFALLFGAITATNQGIREGYDWSAAMLFATLQASAMFAFLIVAGAYLGLIRAPHSLSSARRRILGAMVGACIGTHFAVSFRHQLPVALAGNPSHPSTSAHWLLLVTAALIGAALTVAIESVVRAKASVRRDPTRGRTGSKGGQTDQGQSAARQDGVVRWTAVRYGADDEAGGLVRERRDSGTHSNEQR